MNFHDLFYLLKTKYIIYNGEYTEVVWEDEDEDGFESQIRISTKNQSFLIRRIYNVNEIKNEKITITHAQLYKEHEFTVDLEF